MSRALRPALLLAALLTACPKQPAGGNIPAIPPALSAEVEFLPAAPAVLAGPAGSALWVAPRPGLPLVSLRLVLPGGAVTDPAERPGLASMADAAALRGAGERDAAAFAAFAALHAIEIDVATSKLGTVVHVDCQADKLDLAVGLLADVLLRPRFDAPAVSLLVEERVAQLTQEADEPRVVAAQVGDRVWYGGLSPMGRPTDGTEAAVKAMDPATLQASWAARAQPSGATLITSGAVEAEALRAILDRHLGGWAARAPVAPAAPAAVSPPPAPGAPRLTLVDNPGAAQTVLRVLLPGPSLGDPDRAATELGAVVLGGTFTSRLNRLLREEKGYTYGARAALESRPHSGRVVVATNVFLDKTGPALEDLLRELTRFAAGVDEGELRKAQGAVRTDEIEAAGTRGAVADALADLALNGRAPDALATDLRAALAVPEAQVDGVAKGLLSRGVHIVVVGDLSKVRAPVEAAVTAALGAAPAVEQRDVHGEPVTK
ncbi:MAG: insulinase family protein [Myxococcales bacterium]|nr:insulinase family protein [Myxococcales bacterium]